MIFSPLQSSRLPAELSTLTQQPHYIKVSKRHLQRCHPVYSLRTLVDSVTSSSKQQTIFVGGKGGVGKTTVSSALAAQLALEDLKVLVVSTDPAHSLGDALDEDLRKARGKPVTLTDPLTGGRLQAMEVNAEAALQNFQESLASFDIQRLATSLGVSVDLLESLGLREFSGLLNNPPPGLDELVALGEVLDDTNADKYDVVVVDTAPTGHTLRLLALPQFLNGLFGKLIALRMRLSGLASTLQAFLGDDAAKSRSQAIDTALQRLEDFKTKISKLEERLKDNTQTSFLVVTVPTKLAVQETKRLVTELTSQNIAVNHVVVNQCVGSLLPEPGTYHVCPGKCRPTSFISPLICVCVYMSYLYIGFILFFVVQYLFCDYCEDASTAEPMSEALVNYYHRRRSGQAKWIDKLKEAAADVSASEEYQSNGKDQAPIAITELPFFDVELVGVPALAYVGSQHFLHNHNLAHLMEASSTINRERGPKVVICGGKGGVGKTTTSSSLAVTMAAQGHNVALISTDPAHSLGDAVQMDLRGGKLIDCPLIGVPVNGDGSLSVLEIDPASALSDFKGVVDQLLGGSDSNKATSGSSDLRSTLQDLENVFDTLPAGTDEVVALAKVVNLVKKGNFDRIVLDTAPTGHTLRMLSTPGFLAELIDRLLTIAQKVNSNAAVKMFIAAAAGNAGASRDQLDTAGATAKSKLLSFQLQMYDLEDMFANPDQTEFLIVTVPTELAVRESVRLLNDLTFEAPDMPIKVRNIVVNQVLKDDDSNIQRFLSRVRDGQASSLTDLEMALAKNARSTEITKVSYLDTEPRGVFGLKIMAEELLRPDKKEST